MKKQISWLFALTLVGCDPYLNRSEDQQDGRKTMTESMKLIDQGRPEEAAILLEEINHLHPEDDEVAVALASAYAGIAGLKMSTYYDLFQDIIFSRPLMNLQNQSGSEKFRTLIGKKHSVDQDRFAKNGGAALGFAELRDSLIMFLALSDLLDRLPDCSEEDEMFIREAIVLLENLTTPKKAHHAFRALLRATLMKRELKSKLQTFDDCPLDSAELIDGFRFIDAKASVLIGDIGMAFPREKYHLREIHQRLHLNLLKIDSLMTAQGKTEWLRQMNVFFKGQSLDSCEGP